MSNLKTFLKVVQKLGYPNPSPNSLVIANSINYNLNNFIGDLIIEVGEERANEFVNKTFSSLGATYSPGIKIDIRSDKVLYVTIKDWTIYIDNSTDEKIIDVWNEKKDVIVKELH